MKINVTKVGQNEKEDIFSYRDEFNEEKIIKFPRTMEMTEQEVEEFINDHIS